MMTKPLLIHFYNYGILFMSEWINTMQINISLFELMHNNRYCWCNRGKKLFSAILYAQISIELTAGWLHVYQAPQNM